MLDALRSTFYPPLPTPLPIVEAPPPTPPPLDAAEIKRRLDAIKDKAEGYLLSLHIPTKAENIRIENDKKSLIKLLGRDLNEKDLKGIVKSAYGCSVRVEIDPSHLFAAANASNNSIVIDPFFILKPSDLPPDLQICRFNDDENYLKRLSKWISEKFKIDEKDLSDLLHVFAHYYLLWRDQSEQLHHVLNFGLAHEVGHLHYRHVVYQWDIPLTIILTGCLTAILWSQTSLILALASIIIIFKIFQISLRCLCALYYRNYERSADLFAIKLLKTTEGAEGFFEVATKIDKLAWERSKWYEKLYYAVMLPEQTFHLEHGSYKARLAEIKKAHTFQIPSAQPLKV